MTQNTQGLQTMRTSLGSLVSPEVADLVNDDTSWQMMVSMAGQRAPVTAELLALRSTKKINWANLLAAIQAIIAMISTFTNEKPTE